MRRAGILAILLLIASICGVCAAASSMYESHDQVMLMCGKVTQ